MAGKKAVARKTRPRKATPAREPSLRENLVAMEHALEKGAADLGRRARKEMPAVRAATAKAAKWIVNAAAAMTEDIRAYLVDLWRNLTTEKKTRVRAKPATKKKAAAGRKPAAARKPTTAKKAAPRTRRGTAKRAPARRKAATRKPAARRTAAKKRSPARTRAVGGTK